MGYNPDGSDREIDRKYIYKYDSNGNKVEGSIYDLDGKLDKKSIFKYDSNGNMVEGLFYDSDGSLSG